MIVGVINEAIRYGMSVIGVVFFEDRLGILLLRLLELQDDAGRLIRSETFGVKLR